MSPLELVHSNRVHVFPLLPMLVFLPISLDVASSRAQTIQSAARAAAYGGSPPSAFLVRSYDGAQEGQPGDKGKCLDYGTFSPTIAASKNIPPSAASILTLRSNLAETTGAAQGAGHSVFLNDCATAHPIVVEELQNGRHEVILHAGNQVIGITRTIVTSPGASRDSVPSASHTSTAPSLAALATPASELPLQLLNPLLAGSLADDIFALDGDSIILESSRPCVTESVQHGSNLPNSVLCSHPPPAQLVVQVENARGANGTPLVVGPRNLADSEFWDFLATDNSGADPTTGFVRVANKADLLTAMNQIDQVAQQNNGRAWGSVIKIIDSGNPIDLTSNPAFVDATTGFFNNLVLPTGVTIRGDRRGTNLGPKLLGLYDLNGTTQFNEDNVPHLIEIQGDYVRVTGLRLQGPTRGTTAPIPSVDAILVPAPNNWVGLLIDHNDISDWTNAAVEIYGVGGEMKGGPGTVACPAADPSRNDFVHIERNFIHHNDENVGNGYADVMSDGGAATLLGNTFYMNRHSIAADADVRDQYSAWFNLELWRVPTYYNHPHLWGLINNPDYEQIFDMHGVGDNNHQGGFAGNEVDIAWNTFLPSRSINFTLRGQPCSPDSFNNNVSLRNQNEAIEVWNSNGDSNYYSSSTSAIQIQNNSFADTGYSDPTARLGVGDFDGDGVQDVFLATRAAWYYSPAGKAEWRYLSGGRTDSTANLLFGDFDGDGRTDVVGINGTNLMVSWGGVSDWEVLNSLPPGASITDLAVGNFVDDYLGDKRDDIFWADGSSWHVSSGGSGPFNVVNTSSFRVKDLRFGDFDGDGKTDVFGVVAHSWSYSKSASGSWASGFLQEALAPVSDLVVGDFDGNGIADVASQQPSGTTAVSISHGGRGNWVTHTIQDTNKCGGLPLFTEMAAIGRFDSSPGVDFLIWDGLDYTVSAYPGNEFCIASAGGTVDLQPWSRQDMR
jgi:hypothetical protein